jgi:uncharacterized protein (DUF1778 family)
MAEVRNKRVEIRFRKSEYKCIWEKANALGYSISEYVRLLALNDCKK